MTLDQIARESLSLKALAWHEYQLRVHAIRAWALTETLRAGAELDDRDRRRIGTARATRDLPALVGLDLKA